MVGMQNLLPVKGVFNMMRVGQHVVFIHDDNWPRNIVSGLPVKGIVYTIRAFCPLEGERSLRLVETRAVPAFPFVPVCRKPCCDGEYWLPKDYFRPLKRLKVEDFMCDEVPA